MLKNLTADQVNQFQTQGYCAPIDIMSEDQALSYRYKLELAESNYSHSIGPENRNNAHLVLKCLDDIAFHPAIIDSVEDLIGPDILLYGSVLFIKEPQSKGYVSWHQDATYMALEPHEFVTPWLALTHSNSKNGCMRVIPGSHRQPVQPHRDTFNDDNILTRGQNIDDIDDSEGVDIVLRPGQLSIHHARLIHGSRRNLGEDRRIGVALQCYMSAATAQPGFSGYAQAVRGDVSNIDFELAPRPDQDMQPTNVGWRNRVNSRWAEILYHGADQQRNY